MSLRIVSSDVALLCHTPFALTLLAWGGTAHYVFILRYDLGRRGWLRRNVYAPGTPHSREGENGKVGFAPGQWGKKFWLWEPPPISSGRPLRGCQLSALLRDLWGLPTKPWTLGVLGDEDKELKFDKLVLKSIPEVRSTLRCSTDPLLSSRGGSGWILGGIPCQKGQLDIRDGLPGRWWSHRPRRCLSKDWTWHSVP